MKKYKLVGTYPMVQGNPSSGKFSKREDAEYYAKKLGLTIEEIEEPSNIFDNVIMY